MIALPPLFEEDIKELLGAEAHLLFEALAKESALSIRLNPMKCQSLNLEPLKALWNGKPAWCNSGYYLSKRPLFTLDPLLHGGAYYVQEASSMFLDLILKQLPLKGAIRALDLCAAPGGKSSILLNHIGNQGLVVANEVIRSRAAILKENLIKWGNPHLIITNNDPAAFASFEGFFDLMVVDAPCSGEGMFRKDAMARNEWSPDNVQLCADRQKRILNHCWSALKPNGYLIYSTCTFNRKENEEIVEWLVNELEAESISVEHQSNEIQDSVRSSTYGYHFFPHKTQGEGLFMAVVRKKDGSLQPETIKTKKRSKKPDTRPIPTELNSLIHNPMDYTPYSNGDTVGVIPTTEVSFIELLSKQLRVVYKGCELAELAGKKFKLKHSLAVSTLLNRESVQTWEVSKEEALIFLKKEEIKTEGLQNGWCLITHQHLPLGWIKVIGNRTNNYYPKEWRILMDINKE